MKYEQILADVQGRVGILTMNRPDVLNAMTSTMRREMIQQVHAWNEDDAVGAIVVTGAGRGFCSGADISGFERTVRGESSSDAGELSSADWLTLVRESKPIVCAINGVAVGIGLTMTLPCDIRIAAEGARMSFRFVKLGLTPELASTHYLTYLVGLGRSLELMLTGKFVEAQEADRIGLVNQVCPVEGFLENVVAVAQEIAEAPTWQLLKTKRMIHGHYQESDIGKVQAFENEIFRQAQGTDAHSEALTAFRERRQPRFHS